MYHTSYGKNDFSLHNQVVSLDPDFDSINVGVSSSSIQPLESGNEPNRVKTEKRVKGYTFY